MGIYVWGTGCGASELIERGMELEQITAFVDSFPMNAAGKVLKYKMREDAARRYNLTGDGADTAGPGK